MTTFRRDAFDPGVREPRPRMSAPRRTIAAASAPVDEVSILFASGRLAQLEERLLYTQEVAGSSPAPPTGKALVTGPFLFPAPGRDRALRRFWNANGTVVLPGAPSSGGATTWRRGRPVHASAHRGSLVGRCRCCPALVPRASSEHSVPHSCHRRGGTAIAMVAAMIAVHPGGPDPALHPLPKRGDVIADVTGLGFAAGVTVIGGLQVDRRWWRKGD